MSNTPLILAIDQGGQSSRVAIYTNTGECLHSFSAACATTHTFINGVAHVEQSPRDILLGIRTCIEKIIAVLGDDVKNIIAAGFAGQGSSLLCWDNKTGEALSPVLSWQDIRGEHYLKNIALNHVQAQHLTGLRISPHYGASKMRWCLDNNAVVANAYHHSSLASSSLTIGPIVSYIFWHLLNSNRVDPGHAQRTLLWNLQDNDWDDSLLALFNIPRELLPQCQYHNSHFGDLTLGHTKIPFTASARDQGASLFARGWPDKTACYINIGTGAFIQRLSENLHAPEGLLVSPLWLPENSHEPSLYCWEATVNGAASALSFLQQQTGLHVSPDNIKHALELSPVHECYFLNAVGGLGAPYWRTDLQSSFSDNLSPHEKILAWLESLIFQIAVNLTVMDELGRAQKIYLSGGLSRANGVCQKLADLLQIPVHRSENTDATLQGIACMAAAIPATWEARVEEDIFQPMPNPSLAAAFQLWQGAMTQWLSRDAAMTQ